MSTAPGISARGVRRWFGEVEAVADIDLEAPAGQVTALVGPNGSGKTTLFLVLATLLVPDAGEVSVGGHDPVTEPDAVRAMLGWSPDVFGVYDNLTAREYLEFFAAAYLLPKRERRARADELLETIHLTEYAGSPVHVLSRGQKQRLGLARALVHRPTVLVLDEPASGLDPRSRIDLRELLRAQAAAGTTVLVSSHILSDLQEVADRAVFIQGGRTVGEHSLTDLPQTQQRPWRIKAVDNAGLVAGARRDAHAAQRTRPDGRRGRARLGGGGGRRHRGPRPRRGAGRRDRAQRWRPRSGLPRADLGASMNNRR